MKFETLYSRIESLVKNDNELISYKLNGFDLWPIIKIQILQSTYPAWRELDNEKKKNYRIRKIQKLINIPLLKIKEIYHQSKEPYKCIPKNSTIFITPANSKRVFFKSKYFDVFSDSYIDKENISNSLRLETCRQNKLYSPSYSTSLYIQSSMEFKILIYRLFKKKEVGVFLKELKLVAKNISRKVVKYDLKFNESYFINYVLLSYLKSFYFLNLFKEISPKTINIISFYGTTGFAAVYAAKILNIKCYDVQHGVQGKYHYAYSPYFLNINQTLNTLPDGFKVWTDKDKYNLIHSLNEKFTDEIDVIGNLFIDKFKTDKNFRDEIILEDFKTKYSKNLNCCLITLQPLSNIYFFKSIIEEWKKRGFKNITWMFRFHHDMDMDVRNKYISELNSFEFVDFEYANVTPLFQLLEHCDIHITGSSSVVLEALEFSMPSVITNDMAKDYYDDYIDGENVFWSTSVNDICNFIRYKIFKK